MFDWETGETLDFKEIINLLNELAEEKEYYQIKSGKCEEELLQLRRDNKQLKQQLFETSKELLWATSDEVDRALHYEDEVEELRKEIFE